MFYDENGKRIYAAIVGVITEVIPNTIAARKGVKMGDVVCVLGSYDLTKDANLYTLKLAIMDARNSEKRLVVARKVDNSYRIYDFPFPKGLMGVGIGSILIHDYDKLMEAYKGCNENAQR